MLLTACATVAGAQSPTAAAPATAQATPQATLPGVGGVNNGSASTAPATSGNLDAVAALEGTIQQIYQKVNPSVVNIDVTISATGSSGSGQSPFGSPQGQPSGALGSGFVWDKQGHIVTNNHVVADASSINVVFSDGLTVPAKVVGTDPDSDLAVIQVNVPSDRLQPVTLADSTKVQVGQLAVAIGNPYGQNGSLSVGFVSGLGRELPVNNDQSQSGLPSSTGSYIIPDIIQTDAPINPGNSGGVLVNDKGMVLGVTAAIATSSSSGSGVGFVIPSVIVQKTVPALIQHGAVQHPWVGISGTTMTPELAQPMNLNSDQRGALVVDVTPNSPAAKAGLQGSTQSTTIAGQSVPVGGDVIVSINGSPVKTFDDLITYLARNTDVGQKVMLGILRNGKSMTVDLTLSARPATPPTANVNPTNPINPNNPSNPNNPNNPTPQQPQQASGAYLGISGYSLDAAVNQAMNLPSGQQGVLVVTVQSGGPADTAGLQGGTQAFTDNGQQIMIGGDVITAVNGQTVTGMNDLRGMLSQANPGQQATLTILRNGQQSTVRVQLGTPPATNP
jgi:S1-C subfamily serine protease